MGYWQIKDGQVRLTLEGSKLIERAEAEPESAKRMVLEVKRQSNEGYDEILAFLKDKNRSMDELDAQVKAALGVTWKSRNQVSFRLNWLRSLGFLEREGKEYRLTPAGQVVAGGLPATNGTGDGKGKTVTPVVTEPVKPMLQKAINLANEIETASVKGLDGADLENLTAGAFAFLGFEAEVISGPGNPDVVLTAPMGEARYRVLIDTKSRSNGCVQQNDVSFPALNQHKAKVSADYTMVLGKDFSGGNLETWAKEHEVRLLRTEELKQVLIAHAEGVITLDRLEALFRGGGSTDEAVLSETLAEAEHAVQSMALARLVYDAVRCHQDQEGALNAHSLFYILGGEYPIQAIQATVDLLQSDLLGALAKAQNGTLYTRLTPRMLTDKLTQLQDVLAGQPADAEKAGTS
jgi:DNA-binding HxlR family transcriptional regulator